MKNWLVTGSSRGLGRAIVERALAAGENVFATARVEGSLDDLASTHPERLRVGRLDVTDADQALYCVAAAIDAFGTLDVLVNNAGYGVIAPFEQTTEASFRDQIETNLFGVVNLTRAALPAMRKQRAGHIINVSSVGGRVGTPGLSAYQAAKWAVGGFTESVSQEVAAFGVHMVSVEPGGMRTDWGATANGTTIDILSEYAPSVGAFLEIMPRFVGNEVGDPAKIAKVIFDLTARDDLPAHLVLGSDALHVLAVAEESRRKAADEWGAVSRSTDFDEGDISYLEGSRFN